MGRERLFPILCARDAAANDTRRGISTTLGGSSSRRSMITLTHSDTDLLLFAKEIYGVPSMGRGNW
jgi:hypothetical protein